MTLLDMTPDQLLHTTRAVRKRLDFTKPVGDDVIRECVAAAMQAPSGSNNMTMRFVIVKDEAKRAAIGDIYRQCFDIYKTLPGVYAGSIAKDTDVEQAQQKIVDVVRRLEDAGEIIIAGRGGESSMVV